MSQILIKELFASDIYRRIEEVIKVDQTDQDILHGEFHEYVLTDGIIGHYRNILHAYWDTLVRPHEGIAVWVSGFFGSGKSSFAKMLGLTLENRVICGVGAAKLFASLTTDNQVNVLLSQIAERIPTEAVIFDVSTDRGIKSGNQTLTEIMYRLFLKHLGYASDLDLAELEITLEQKGQLERFEDLYRQEFHQEWNDHKHLFAFALSEAGKIMHMMFPERYQTPDSWVSGAKDRADITPGSLAERCKELMSRRRPGKTLVFVIDEVGQFVARDVQKMLDLQAVVQSFGRVGRGKMWIVVTSQEKLTELVGGLDNSRVELARLMDRFPLQVHLEPSDISEVTSKRVLKKKANALTVLRQLYESHSGRLTANTRLSADIRLPELTAHYFQDLYPLLPYQIDLIIQVVSGLRTQGGAAKHVGGANRTIIKLAQQLLIHGSVHLAEHPVGDLVSIHHIYDLIQGNISSEIRGKIASIPNDVSHPLAQNTAKAICLLQYVQSIHRTAENIAATLCTNVGTETRLPEVKEALAQLQDAHKVRVSDGQYRIPTPAEDDWETTRTQVRPRSADTHRIYVEALKTLWDPRPSHHLLDARTFKAGIVYNGRSLFEEDIPFYIEFSENDRDYDKRLQEVKSRSQLERKAVFWLARLNDACFRETDEIFRSQEMLAKKERSTKTKDESALVADEKLRLRHHESELRNLVRQALLEGMVFFQGYDRRPTGTQSTVNQAAGRVLAAVLPQIYDRFQDGAARVNPKDLDALLTAENLRGLPQVFSQLNLVRDEKGQAVVNTEATVLREVMARIENKAGYGEFATGRYLVDEFEREPYGWSLDVVRLFVITLLRAGKIRATSRGVTIESAMSTEARTTFPNNNLFRAASFHKRVSGTTLPDWLDAETAFREVFGKQLPELQAGVIAEAIKREVAQVDGELQDIHTLLLTHRLPGDGVFQQTLHQIRNMRTGTDDDTIVAFNGGYKELKDAVRRARIIRNNLNETHLADLERARTTLKTRWPALETEADLPEPLRQSAAELKDCLERETFYADVVQIFKRSAEIEAEHNRRWNDAVARRKDAYQAALHELQSHPAWAELDVDQQKRVSGPLVSRSDDASATQSTLPLLQAEINACSQHLQTAIQQMMELIEGSRLVSLRIGDFFSERIETPEQLDTALSALRQKISDLISEGKKVWVR